MRITLFKLKQPKRFRYKPRYYDPVLDDLHSRIKITEAEIALEEGAKLNPSDQIRANLRKAWKTPQTRKKANRASNVRVLVLAGILFLLFYVYFFTNIIPGS